MTINIYTLYMVLIFSGLVQIAAISFQYVLNRTYKGILWWIWSLVLYTAGYLYVFHRIAIWETQPQPLVPSLLFLGGLLCQYISLMKFLEKPFKSWFVISLMAVSFGVNYYFSFAEPDLAVTTAFNSLVYAGIAFLTAGRIRSKRDPSLEGPAALVVVVLIGMGLFYTFRMASVLFLPDSPDLNEATPLQMANLVVALVACNLLTFGLVILLNQRLNNEIKQGKEHFEQIFSSSPDATAMTRLEDGIMIDINSSFIDLTGHPREEVIGRSILDLNLWPDPQLRERMISEVRRNGFIRNYEAVLQRKNGLPFTALISSNILRLNDHNCVVSLARDISDRQEMLRQLDNQRRRLESVIEGTQAATWEWNVQSGETVFDERWARLLGYTLEELQPVNIYTWERLVNPVDIREVRSVLERHFKGELTYYDCEYRMQHKDGQWVWIHDRGRLITRTPEGKPLLMCGTHTDISCRKQTEETLQTSETRFRTIYSSSIFGIELYDDQGQLLEANPATLRMFGVESVRELHPHRLFEALDLLPDLKERLLNHCEVHYQTVFDFDYARANGVLQSTRDGKADLDIIVTPLTVAQGTPLNGYLVQIQEITEQKRSESLLRASEEKHRQLVENSHDIIYTMDVNGVFTYVSPACQTILGFPSETLLGLSFGEVLHPDDLAECWRRLEQSVQTGRTQSGVEYRIRHQDGTWRWHSSSGIPLYNEKGDLVGFEGSAADITERKLLEERDRTLYAREKLHRQQLEEEARNRIRFIDILAHELKGAMTPILISSEMLQDILNDAVPDTSKKLAENVFNGTRLLVSRLDELLEVARYARGMINLNLEPVDPACFLEQVVARFTPFIFQRSQKLQIDLAEDLPVINLDPSRIEQVVINLLSNASKYSPQNSCIRFSAFRQEHSLVVSVQDEGIGISEEDQNRLFQPYQRVGAEQQKTRGLGLGLTVVKYILEAHRGRIWLNSKPGQGSTFSFAIPIE